MYLSVDLVRSFGKKLDCIIKRKNLCNQVFTMQLIEIHEDSTGFVLHGS